jgi:hypothetical protein
VTKAFLSDFTDAVEPSEIELSCRAPDRWLQAEVADKRFAEARRLFGPPTRGDAATGAIWEVNPDHLEAAVSFELAAHKVLKDSLPPSWLHFNYYFRWRSPWAGEDVKGLGDSGIALHFSGSSVLIQPHFVFHASLESPEFREQLLQMEAAVPFRFSDAHFRRWLIPRSGTSAGRYLKPPKDWRRGWRVS